MVCLRQVLTLANSFKWFSSSFSLICALLLHSVKKICFQPSPFERTASFFIGFSKSARCSFRASSQSSHNIRCSCETKHHQDIHGILEIALRAAIKSRVCWGFTTISRMINAFIVDHVAQLMLLPSGTALYWSLQRSRCWILTCINRRTCLTWGVFLVRHNKVLRGELGRYNL